MAIIHIIILSPFLYNNSVILPALGLRAMFATSLEIYLTHMTDSLNMLAGVLKPGKHLVRYTWAGQLFQNLYQCSLIQLQLAWRLCHLL